MKRTALRYLMLPVIAVGMLLPATAAHAAPAKGVGSGCEGWITGGASAFVRCLTNPGGFRDFRAVAFCPGGQYAYGPWVPFGQTTWATCRSGNAYDVAVQLRA